MYCDFCLKINISSKDIFTQIVKEEGDVIYKTDTITAVKSGCVFDKSSKPLSSAQIVNLYKTHGVDILKIFDGLYNLVIVDTKLEKAFIFHGYVSGDTNVYYTFDGENIFISSSIKNIINASPNVERYLDEESIEEFIDKGYLTENKTLIYNIFKTSGKKYTEFNLKNGLVAERADYLVEYDKRDNVSAEKYDRIFDDSVLKCLRGKYAIGLSEDSNCIYTLHHARLNEPERKPIKVYGALSSFDGKENIAKEISKSFDNVECNVAQIGKNVLNFLPLIVYITEGTAFDCNAFKDFEIARMLKRDGISAYVSSDGLNGIFNKSFFDGFDKGIGKIKKSFSFSHDKSGKDRKVSQKPDSLFADRLLNAELVQSAMIYNYFDVRYFNSCIFKRYLQAVYKKVSKGGAKEFHQNAVKSNVCESAVKIAENFSHPIDVMSLFTGEIDAKTLAEIASNSYFFKKYKRKYSDNRDKANYCLRIIYLELFQTVFVGRGSKQMLRSKRFNYSLKAFFSKYFTKENEI